MWHPDGVRMVLGVIVWFTDVAPRWGAPTIFPYSHISQGVALGYLLLALRAALPLINS